MGFQKLEGFIPAAQQNVAGCGVVTTDRRDRVDILVDAVATEKLVPPLRFLVQVQGVQHGDSSSKFKVLSTEY
ncbi:MAG: hypothetical protein K8L97_09855 [Anaerolineae bacterium]|nr:hypothetical protein [Anaerolineae bacterium]